MCFKNNEIHHINKLKQLSLVSVRPKFEHYYAIITAFSKLKCVTFQCLQTTQKFVQILLENQPNFSQLKTGYTLTQVCEVWYISFSAERNLSHGQ